MIVLILELISVFELDLKDSMPVFNLCFIGKADGSVTLRSLMDLAATPPDAAP